jgi:hypothetical protein
LAALDHTLPWAGAFMVFCPSMMPLLASPPSAPRDALNCMGDSARGRQFGVRRCVMAAEGGRHRLGSAKGRRWLVLGTCSQML